MIAVVILLTSFSENVAVAEASYQMLESFIILQSGKGLTCFNKDNSDHYSGEKSTMKLSGVSVFENTRKNLSQILYSNLKVYTKNQRTTAAACKVITKLLPALPLKRCSSHLPIKLGNCILVSRVSLPPSEGTSRIDPWERVWEMVSS